jgi:hypothetical protein
MMHSWPYLRAEVQSLTSKLELPPLTLPPLVSGQIPNFVTVERLPLPQAPPVPTPLAEKEVPQPMKAKGAKRYAKKAARG